MFGVCNMSGELLEGKSFTDYIDYLTNKIFSILPTFEEEGYSSNLVSRIDNLKIKIDGFLILSECDKNIRLEVMSLLSKLNSEVSHKEVRYCVLRVCSLLSKLKSGDM